MNRNHVCVAKIGGSLLGSADLPGRVETWLSARSAARPDSHLVLIVGGGPLVDAVRDFDSRSPLATAESHWLAIAWMDFTASWLGMQLPELPIVEQLASLQDRLLEPGATILAPGKFLRESEPGLPGTKLAWGWSVTSDAIAGRVAVALAADELVLLKSAPPPRPAASRSELESWADAGYIDNFLANMAGELPVVTCLDFNGLAPRRAATAG